MSKAEEKPRRNIISRRVNSIPPSGIRKFFDLIATSKDILSLSIGEPDFVTPWHIRDAGMRSLEEGRTSYTSNSGMIELREEVVRYLKLHHGVSYDPASEILITVGTSEALDLFARAILDPGDEMAIPDPYYVAYPANIVLSGGVPLRIPTREENNFVVKASDIEARVTARTKAILIGYPSNPTGAVASRRELEDIALLAEKDDLLVVSDEIYARLVYGMEYTSFPSLPGMKERTVLIGGLSKSHAMTGWRIGYVAARQEIIQAVTKIHQYTMLSAPTMAQMAAIEALRNGDEDVKQMDQEYNRRRRTIVKGLREIGLTCFEPRGAFYAFPSINITGMTSEEFSERLIEEEKVAVVPGSAFGECGEGFVRCSYAASLSSIEEALRRMGRFVERYRKG
ncbi:MAG: aminotransferase class I/II-fold pyridoxal phosphate-dependent enzyme [Dehalococcoidia bacterium]|nr:aminotransferase class I/II-fold pyridoxal phosphate-dependent enzyme [Dehalococcoidia bacterium]